MFHLIYWIISINDCFHSNFYIKIYIGNMTLHDANGLLSMQSMVYILTCALAKPLTQYRSDEYFSFCDYSNKAFLTV